MKSGPPGVQTGGPRGVRDASQSRTNRQNFTTYSAQVPFAPGAGFLAAIPGEVEANQADPRAHRGRPYPGSGTWERHVWVRGQPLPLAPKAVLRCLVDHNFGGGPVCPGIARIAEETGLSRAGARKALRWLRLRRWIDSGVQLREDGGQTSNLYFVMDPPSCGDGGCPCGNPKKQASQGRPLARPAPSRFYAKVRKNSPSKRKPGRTYATTATGARGTCSRSRALLAWGAGGASRRDNDDNDGAQPDG